MAGNVFAYFLLAVAIRQLKLDLSYPEILAIRSAGGLAIGLVLGWHDRRLFREVWRSPLQLHLARSALHAMGAITVVWSVANLPLGLVASIEFSGPLFAAALGAIAFGTRPARFAWVGLGLIFAGAAAIVNQYMDVVGLAIIIPFSGVAILTCTNIMLGLLSERQSTHSILLLMNMIQLVIFMTLSLLGADTLRLPPSSLTTTALFTDGTATLLLAVVLMAVSGYMTQASLSQATRHGTAVQVAALDTLRIPALAVAGALLFGEPLNQSLLIPSAIIMCGAILTTYLDRSKRGSTRTTR
ncbi:DMT family transporter [Bosea sp. Tri-44]|uniref:DMT family transporter n=1 Tax=Bosea sp. Tri-44 TaxID=1972137 RepID=UPI00100F44BF|nr:DMT family transporter [Bosea sp. Tri-44]